MFRNPKNIERVPAKPAADAARILDRNKVSNFLWGWLAVGLVGKDFRYPEVDFVVPDDKLELSTKVLVKGGFVYPVHYALEWMVV
ncbi:uncharacterized protein BDV17DRAFT_288206 [Aspergillus undulatus]|uniref:uncharacterized protein n=1 Tax=Aspergillus undulatus TaxID=1810928 RepID=UPI003CCD4B8B